MSVDGELLQLTDDLADDLSPDWSPDGSRIAFSSNRDGKQHIYVMNADGSSPTEITHSPAEDTEPSWSADGKRITFARSIDGHQDIYLMNADGSDQTRLTSAAETDSSPAINSSPRWSSDGKILFVDRRDGQRGIYVIGGDGAITRLSEARASRAVWSPDATKVAFNAPSLEKIAGHPWLEIFVMESDGGNVRMITRIPNSTFVPCWSPDGASIAFVMEAEPRANIFQVDLNGGNLRRLTAGPKFDDRPAFSPDGSKLAFQSNRSGNYEIYVMNLR
jgi:Tol biopolymer transport system component